MGHFLLDNYSLFGKWIPTSSPCLRSKRLFPFSPTRKTLGNNDLNQVVASSGFSENKGLGGGSVSRAHKTWSRSFLFKDFPPTRATGNLISFYVVFYSPSLKNECHVRYFRWWSFPNILASGWDLKLILKWPLLQSSLCQLVSWNIKGAWNDPVIQNMPSGSRISLILNGSLLLIRGWFSLFIFQGISFVSASHSFYSILLESWICNVVFTHANYSKAVLKHSAVCFFVSFHSLFGDFEECLYCSLLKGRGFISVFLSLSPAFSCFQSRNSVFSRSYNTGIHLLHLNGTWALGRRLLPWLCRGFFTNR